MQSPPSLTPSQSESIIHTLNLLQTPPPAESKRTFARMSKSVKSKFIERETDDQSKE